MHSETPFPTQPHPPPPLAAVQYAHLYAERGPSGLSPPGIHPAYEEFMTQDFAF